MRQHEPEHLLDVMFATTIGDTVKQIERTPTKHDDDLAKPFPTDKETT